MIEYDEFSYFSDNAAEAGLPFGGPPVVRRTAVETRPGFNLSALVWGSAPPELVFLHGGSQNAHTWDTVALAIRRPLVAIDMPGHGHSDGISHGDIPLEQSAADIAAAVRVLAPDAAAVVGMSLGGLTTLALADHSPELVRRVVLVDVLPSVDPAKGKVISDFVDGPELFGSFDKILERTIRFNPTRSESSLRRGILHNAEQQPDGTWRWRHVRPRAKTAEPGARPTFDDRFGRLWNVVSSIKAPLMLVRGMEQQSVVNDEHEAELRRRLPSARIEHVVGAGHSVQGDQPLELAALIDDFAFGPGSRA